MFLFICESENSQFSELKARREKEHEFPRVNGNRIILTSQNLLENHNNDSHYMMNDTCCILYRGIVATTAYLLNCSVFFIN